MGIGLHIGAYIKIIGEGTKLATSENEKYICPKCNEDKSKSFTFCPDCGTKCEYETYTTTHKVTIDDIYDENWEDWESVIGGFETEHGVFIPNYSSVQSRNYDDFKYASEYMAEVMTENVIQEAIDEMKTKAADIILVFESYGFKVDVKYGIVSYYS